MDYTRLDDACLASGLTRDALLRKGAEGELSIFVVPHPSWAFESQFMRAIEHGDNGADYFCMAGEVAGPLMSLLLLRVAPIYLQNYLNYPETAATEWFTPDGIPESDVSVLMYKGDKPLLLKDCCLVVKNDDLAALSGKKKRGPPIRQAKTDMVPIVNVEVATIPPAKRQRTADPDLENDRYIDVLEVAALLGVSKNTVLNYERDGTFPKSVKYGGGRTTRWHKKEILEWIANQSKNKR